MSRIKLLSAEASLGQTASTVGSAKKVRVVNAGATAIVLERLSAADVLIGSTTVLPTSGILVEKNMVEKLRAATGTLLVSSIDELG